MKTISVINLKGGVGKTITAINFAYILAEKHGRRVLLVDNDKQGNSSKFFNLHSYDAPSIADVLTIKGYQITDAIQNTQYEGLDILPANMNLLTANKQILMDMSWMQQTRLKNALEQVAGEYDYCIIDNAPDLNMSVINALVACDDVIIPIKVDRFAFDGLAQLIEQINDMKDHNPGIRVAGCIITMYDRTCVNVQGEKQLKGLEWVPVFLTVIRKTTTVDQTTFEGRRLLDYAPDSTATIDYIAVVDEYLKGAAARK